MIRHELPAYSPVSLTQVARAAGEALSSPGRARERLANYLEHRFRAEHAVLTASGTQALQLAIECAQGDRAAPDALIALPAYACYDVLSAAVGAQARVVFYDVDPVSLTPDAGSLRVALDCGAQAFIVANLFGFPLDWDLLRGECARTGALCIEDAAQGLGATWQGAEAGSFGDLSILSFGRGKGWTGGGGGALLLRSGTTCRTAFEARVGPSRPADGSKAAIGCIAQWTFGRPWLYGLPASWPGLRLGETAYRPPARPRGISGFVAATVARSADASAREVDARRTRAQEWCRVIDEVSPPAALMETCRPLSRGGCGYLRLPVTASDRAVAEWLSGAGGRLGIARGYPRELPSLPQAEPLAVGGRLAFDGAYRLASTLVTFPTHGRVSMAVPRAIREFLADGARPR